MREIDISVILTFHNEGFVIHKTFLALKRMLIRLDENDISYEIIAHVDNGDDDTKECLKKIGADFDLKFFANSFGNPSASRNYAVEKARGKYVCLMDGDDLFSENWLLDSYNVLEKEGDNIILHPEFQISFGLDEQPRLWHMDNSYEINRDLKILLGRNRWCSGTFLSRSTANNNPYLEAVGCYGYEDWWYNCETRGRGIRHNVTPNSISFYRVRQNSTYHLHINASATIPYCDAFSFERMEEIFNNEPIADDVKFKASLGGNKALRFLQIGHKVLRHTPVVRKLDNAIMRRIEKRRAEKIYHSLPEAVLKEWKNINKIDGAIYPDPEIVSRMPFYCSEVDDYGRVFCKIMHEIKKAPDYVFMMPNILSIGGTEKVLANYLKAIKKIHSDWHILVLGKLPEKNPYNIPEDVVFIDFNSNAFNCADWDLGFILTKLAIQANFKRIHIVNNEFFYRWAISNKELLKTNNIEVNISFFMHEYADDEERIQSFAEPFLYELAPCINKIFADNATIVDDLKERIGLPDDMFSVHYQPVDLPIRKAKKTTKGSGPHKILWAGRVAPQKRPDILKKVSKRLPANYSIDVFGRIEQSCYKKDYFKDCKNINYKGAFNDIKKLPIDDYDVFLYTSQTDGLPNTLLEISSLGLPIVATREGGVPDFIEDKKTGRLIDLNDIDGYVEAIVETVDSNSGKKYVEAAQNIVKNRHNWKKFIEKVKKDI